MAGGAVAGGAVEATAPSFGNWISISAIPIVNS